MGLSTIRVKKISEAPDRIILNYGLWDSVDGTIVLDKINEKIWIEKACKEDEGKNKLIYGDKATLKIASRYYNGGLEDEFIIR